jgi:DNA-binding PadR family transcriptional regulator
MNTKLICLSVLSFGPNSGYEIKKIVEQRLSLLIDVSTSGIYKILNCLLESEYVSCEAVEQDALPNKKIYSLTDKGIEHLVVELAKLPPEHRIRSQFGVLLVFSKYLSKERIAEIFDIRREKIQERIQDCQERLLFLESEDTEDTQGRIYVLKYSLHMLKAELEYLNGNSLLE